MLPVSEEGDAKGRTAMDNATVRTVFVIGPDKKIKLMLTYPMCTGRNFDEVLRVLDSIQLTAKHKVATPVNWKSGDDVIIIPAVSDEEAKKKYACIHCGEKGHFKKECSDAANNQTEEGKKAKELFKKNRRNKPSSRYSAVVDSATTHHQTSLTKSPRKYK